MGKLKIFYAFTVLFISSLGFSSLAVAQEIGDKQNGVASWYGSKYHGRRTSSGEVYNRHKMTAAHNGLPLGTVVKVTNLVNDESVIVKINDRGPFRGNRIIDLSEAAARKIHSRKAGLADVAVEVLELPEAFLAQKASSKVSEPLPVAEPKPVLAFHKPDLTLMRHVALEAAKASAQLAFVVQAGSFNSYENAVEQFQKLQHVYHKMPVALVEEMVSGKAVHRILVGRYLNRTTAEQARQDLARRGFDGLVREMSASGSRLSAI